MFVLDASKSKKAFAEHQELAHIALNASKNETRKGKYNLQLVSALHSKLQKINKSSRSFATKNAELYITWEGWLLLNSKRSQAEAEKVQLLKDMVTTGQRTDRISDIKAGTLPKDPRLITNVY